MNIQFLTRICPEAECIFLLERRFRPGMDAQNNIGQVRHYLSDKYDIPPFELEPLLQPLAEVENYVNSNQTLQHFLDVPENALDHVTCINDLVQFLMKNGCTEDVKWVCTALYYSMDEYLEELDVILRKATGLFLEHLPDVTDLCRQTAAYAKEQIGDDPSRVFHNLNVATQPSAVTVYPCLMGFHGLSWDFADSRIYFGVYYEALTNLIQKYSDQSAW